MTKASVYLKSLGCRLNEAELNQWAIEFDRRGLSVTTDAAQADCFVINTCAVTQEAVRKSRQTIRKLQKQSPQAKVVASGCYVTLSPEESHALGLDLVVQNASKADLVKNTLETFALPAAPAQQTGEWATGLFRRGRSRAFIKAQDGCRYQCTFCIVTHARGAEQSKPVATIIDEINQYADEGIQEVIISGVHLGGYGSDNNSSLAAMLREVLTHTSVPRIRLGSVEPWGLDEDFFALFSNPRMMPHLHLPLQSGSDDMLKKMARRCKRADFLSLVEQAKSSIPNLTLSTDIIVGFPGESDDDFQASMSALESLPLLHAHIFPYSAREGTRAAGYKDQVDSDIKKTRVTALHKRAKAITIRELNHQLGNRARVLWEHKITPYPADQARCYIHGHTENYIPVVMPVPTERAIDFQHQLMDVTLSSIAPESAAHGPSVLIEPAV